MPWGPQPVTTTYRDCTIAAGNIAVFGGNIKYEIAIKADVDMGDCGSVWDSASESRKTQILLNLYEKQARTCSENGSTHLALANWRDGMEWRTDQDHPNTPVSAIPTDDFSDDE